MKNQIHMFIVLCASMHLLFAQVPNETVDLEFAWPDGLSLSVEQTFTRNGNIGPIKERVSSRSKFLWRLEKHGSEHRIMFSDFDVISPEPKPKSNDPIVNLEYISRKIQPILPTLVVDSNAQPLRLDGLDEVRSHVAREIRLISGLDDKMSQRHRSMLLSDEAMELRAWEDWNRMIQIWSGNRGAEIGGSSQTSGVTGHVPNEPIETVFVYRVDQGPKPNTVKLTAIQMPKMEQLRRALDSMLGMDVSKALQLPEDHELIYENRFTTICDPSTLIPISYVKTKLWGAIVGENRQFRGRVDTWSYSFNIVESGTPKKSENQK